MAVRFTSRNFHPPHVFARKPAEEPVEPVPVEAAPVEPVPVESLEPVPVEPAQPDEPMDHGNR